MAKRLIRIISVSIGLLFTFCSEPGRSPEIRQVVVSDTVEIPLQVYTAEGAALDPQTLTVTAGAEDELPQGPASFDILPDGGFVISDPLRNRLVFFNSSGQYLREESIGLAPGSVRSVDGNILVEKLYSEETFQVNAGDQLTPVESPPEQENGQARRLGGTRGIVTRSIPARSGVDTLNINFESDTETLVSLQTLGADAGGNTYVALEVSSGGSPIKVEKLIRKYDADGKLTAQISDIFLDHFALPIDQFRVREGRVYQMTVQKNKVVFYIWNTD